jgi:cephalosporin hydroxylase
MKTLKELLKERCSRQQIDRLARYHRELVSVWVTIAGSKDLCKLAVRFGTDKWGSHFYAARYQQHFKEIRFKKIYLIEIGIGGYGDPRAGGGSLRMWKHFFRFGQIVGLDIYEKALIQESRIRTFRGSQDDPQFLEDVIRKTGNPDIIIDDGSHVSSKTIRSFECLFPLLNDGGWYAVEDLQTSYWPAWNADSKDGPTAMEYFKDLADGLNFQENPARRSSASYFDQNITQLHFYHNLVLLRKGKNVEPSIWGSYIE